MEQNLTDDEFSHWFSTYGLITSQRILGHYQINLPQKELIPAVKNQNSFYHVLIQVPLKNVLNGIILQQGNDYHIYAQKLYIDYLLSGESGKPPEAPGSSTREALEAERQELVTLGEHFNETQLAHDGLISSTQSGFIKLTKELKGYFDNGINLIHKILSLYGMEVSKSLVKDAVTHAIIYCGINTTAETSSRLKFIDTMNEILKVDLTDNLKQETVNQLGPIFDVLLTTKETIDEYLAQVDEITRAARSYRHQFYDKVLKVIELIKMLPEYRINPEQDAVNRESLQFDKSIGES